MEKVKHLMSVMEKGSPREKIAAATELAKQGIFEKMDVLVKELENEDWEIKTDAAYYLGKVGWYPATNRIGEMIVIEKMYEIKNTAIYALQSMGYPEGVPFIIEGLKDENFEVREDARNALYRLFGDKILQLIDPDEEQSIEDELEREQTYTKDALTMSVWWANNEKLYIPGKVYFFGELATPNRIFKKFREEPLVNDAYLTQLQDLTGQDFGKPSNKMIKLWENWLNQNQDKFLEGEKYYYGNMVKPHY